MQVLEKEVDPLMGNENNQKLANDSEQNADEDTKINNVQDLLQANVNCTTSAPLRLPEIPKFMSQLSSVSELFPFLYLCGANALRPGKLEELEVNLVVNCTVELPNYPLPSPEILYFRVAVKDTKDSDLQQYFHKVTDLIEMVRQSNGRALVHCVAGVSRSASICIAYLIKYAEMTLRQAYEFVKCKRTQIRPNNGFFQQLIEFERSISGHSTVKMVFIESLNQEFPDVYQDEFKNMELIYQKYRKFFANR